MGVGHPFLLLGDKIYLFYFYHFCLSRFYFDHAIIIIHQSLSNGPFNPDQIPRRIAIIPGNGIRREQDGKFSSRRIELLKNGLFFLLIQFNMFWHKLMMGRIVHEFFSIKQLRLAPKNRSNARLEPGRDFFPRNHDYVLSFFLLHKMKNVLEIFLFHFGIQQAKIDEEFFMSIGKNQV